MQVSVAAVRVAEIVCRLLHETGRAVQQGWGVRYAAGAALPSVHTRADRLCSAAALFNTARDAVHVYLACTPAVHARQLVSAAPAVLTGLE